MLKLIKKRTQQLGSDIAGNVVNPGSVSSSNKLPQTGVNDFVIIGILIASVVAVIVYIRYRKIDI